jgi:hypothetical protein
MTTVQQVYRELRRHLSKVDARYAAPRLCQLYKQHRQEEQEAAS